MGAYDGVHAPAEMVSRDVQRAAITYTREAPYVLLGARRSRGDGRGAKKVGIAPVLHPSPTSHVEEG